MRVIDFLIELHNFCHFQTKEGKKVGKASNSELRRWCNNSAVVINGERLKWDDKMPIKIDSLVLFPKNPTTLW